MYVNTNHLPDHYSYTHFMVGILQAFQIIKSATLKPDNKVRKVTDCIWWHSSSGHDFGTNTISLPKARASLWAPSPGIISSETGTIRFVNLSTGDVTRVKCKHPVLKMDLVADPDKQFTVRFDRLPRGGPNSNHCSVHSILFYKWVKVGAIGDCLLNRRKSMEWTPSTIKCPTILLSPLHR